jgi:hypothetical protein
MKQKFEDLQARSQYISPLKTLIQHTSLVRCMAFSSDGYRLASASGDGTVLLWEVSTGNLLSTFADPQAYSVAFSADGCWLAWGSIDHTVSLLEVATGSLISVFKEPMDSVFSVAFSADGLCLACGAGDEMVYVWRIPEGRLAATLKGHTGGVRSVAFTPDGHWLASGSEDQSIRLWEVPGGRLVTTLTGHQRSVCCVAFSADGRWLASGSDDRTIHLWEAQTGHLITTFTGHTGRVNGIVFSPNGRVLVSTSIQDATVRLWEIESNRLITTLSQARSTQTRVNPLALSADGCLLATYAPDTVNTIQLWDISPLDVGPVSLDTPSPQEHVTFDTYEVQMLLRTQMRTLPLCHVLVSARAPACSVSWLRGAATAGWPLPLALAYDLGLILSQPADRYTLVKPAYLPFDEDTSAYVACLQRLAAYPLVRELPFWSPPLSDAILSIVLARLVEGLEVSQDYRVPVGPVGVRFLRTLDRELAHADPTQLWQQMPPEARPSWRSLLTPAALARLERNMQALDREELRFLAHYGPSLGSPDPRTLLDLLTLTGLPGHARLALQVSLRLLPQLSASTAQRPGGLQTYPEGGYDGLAHQGSLESLLPGEAVYPDDLFLHRILNHEALYYGRERPRERGRELAYLVGQMGWGLGGDGQVVVRALLLALGEAMRQRGYQVLYSLAGTSLSNPYALEKPEDIGRVLYAQEKGSVNSEVVLQGVLDHLRTWRLEYRKRHVFWVLSEDFDRDTFQEHLAWYRALRAECQQQVWYVRVGSASSHLHSTERLPVTAHSFDRWQIVESGRLWDHKKVSL